MKIIAEFGSNLYNHDWNFREFCIAAHLAGADACKVQLFRADHFPEDERASKKLLEFPRERLFEFVQNCHEYKLEAGASVFDFDAVDMVARHCDFIKLAAREQDFRETVSGELYQAVYAQSRKKHIIRSISDLRFVNYDDKTTTLWAVPKYPATLGESIFQLIKWRKFVYSSPALWAKKWGWSSHTKSIWDCVLAAKFGASVIEKHLALAPTDIEAGHSLLPGDFSRMVRMCK